MRVTVAGNGTNGRPVCPYVYRGTGKDTLTPWLGGGSHRATGRPKGRPRHPRAAA